MKHQKHTQWSATAAIAAALALSATPLAAQSTDATVADAPAVQIPPAEPVPAAPASPTPAIVIPDVAAAPAASGAAASEPEPAPAATTTTTTSRTTVKTARSAAPATRSTTRSTTTRTTAVAPAAAAVPVAATPAPANDVAPLPDEAAAPVAAAPTPAPQPTPAQTSDVVGTLGIILLALLALVILAAGLLFLRRRHPVAAEVEEAPIVADTAEEPSPVYAAAPVAEPVAPTPIRRRDANPVAGALPSDGAAVDLPAKLPESYEERSALLDRMVAAKPDRANPFTDRRARLRRARLILQSLGTTFEREPLIDLSQYPNNWPELQRPRYKAA